ncbi:glycosyltransferase family 4 protein [Oceaniglobus ichthyenteri]|uniref:glycosyltransferase family 4 protein n=1 Tax=Oceaniglobus ichthyenteri TaxID=2136177 RepID=UPI000D38D555|nr:glycosyltransferase family 4 protein [Oceaniglobus ichthyenteri]
MKFAYLMNTYPQPSQSFIRREIHALERQGFDVLRLATRRFDDPLVDPANEDERQRTEYILRQGMGKLVMTFLRRCGANPSGAWTAFKLAMTLARNGGGNPARPLAYLLEAGYVAQRCIDGGARHLHCHFGTNAPAIAMLAHALGGPVFSFTVHGPEEFDRPEALSLGLKINRAAFAVGVSEFGRSQLYRWAGFSDWPKLKVVHCGIEPTRFPATKPFPARSPLRVVSIGRFAEQKGQMILIHAFARLRDTHPDMHLTLVGDGPMRADIERAIGQAGIGPMITLTGWLDETGVNDELANSHALIMPSFAEGLPVVTMEAMASGRPVISTYIAGIPELVTSECGWLVPAGDADALADALIALNDLSVDEMRAMGERCRTRAMARHNVDIEAAKLADHIRAVVD